MVVEFGSGFRFTDEAPPGLLIGDRFRRQELDGYPTFELRVFGEVDLTHPARTEPG